MDFEHKISRLELQLKLDDALLHNFEAEFKTEAAKFLRQWWWDMTAQIVQRTPKVTKEHSGEGISTLKARVTSLRERAEEVAEEFLSDQSAWWHKLPRNERYKTERYYFRSERIGPKKLDTILRIAMGAVAPILHDFGYIEERRASQWLEWDEAGEYHPDNARHYYPYAIDWPSELITTARSYGDRVDQSKNRLHELQLLTRQKAEREAESPWGKS
jgi:hypothetical protein